MVSSALVSGGWGGCGGCSASRFSSDFHGFPGNPFVRGACLRLELDGPAAVAFCDLAHRECGRGSETIVADRGEVAQALDRDDGIVVLAEDVLERGQALDERPRLVRVQVGEKLERVAESLSPDAQAVVVVGRESRRRSDGRPSGKKRSAARIRSGAASRAPTTTARIHAADAHAARGRNG